MSVFRHAHVVCGVAGLALLAAIGPLSEAAAQAQPQLLPQVAYQRLDSLETAALSGATFAQRLNAVSTIIRIQIAEDNDGDCRRGRDPAIIRFPGLVTRLAAVYRRSPDTQLRRAILRGMLFVVAECAEAVALLASAAEEAPVERTLPQSSVLRADDRGSLQEYAIGMLSELGAMGEATLRRLHGQGTVRDPSARVLLESLSKRGFRPPST